MSKSPQSAQITELEALLASEKTVSFKRPDARNVRRSVPTVGGIGSRLSALGLHEKQGGAWRSPERVDISAEQASPVQGARALICRTNAQEVKQIRDRFESEGWETVLEHESGSVTIWAGPAGWDFDTQGDGTSTS